MTKWSYSRQVTKIFANVKRLWVKDSVPPRFNSEWHFFASLWAAVSSPLSFKLVATQSQNYLNECAKKLCFMY